MDGLFNFTLFHRHTELFRSCNSRSDYKAKSHLQEWTKGFVQMPNNAMIPIKDIKKCLPDTWKVFTGVVTLWDCYTVKNFIVLP